MIPWNAANDFVKSRSGFSSDARSTSEGAGPSASFDPARTGDPSPGTTGRTGIGVGHVGSGSTFGLPTRNPIGFAPTDPERMAPSEPRFHTEISFKRHHAPASPLASSHVETRSGDEPESDSDAADQVWKLPAAEAADRGRVEETQAEVLAPSTADGGAETKSEAHDELAAEEPQMVEEQVDAVAEKHDEAEKTVPFYKRELSFRRRKSEPEQETVVASDADEPVSGAPVTAGPVEEEPAFVHPFAEETVADAPVSDDPVFDEPVFDEDEPVFDEPDFAEPIAEESLVDEPVSVEPFAPAELVSYEAVADEPLAEEHLDDEPIMEAPTLDEPQDDVLAADESELDDAPTIESPVVDEPIAAESVDDSTSDDRSRNGKRKSSRLAAPARKSGRGGRGKTIVGLKIGASQIAAAVVTESDGRHDLVQLARRPIDSGLVVDGEIRDEEALAHQLKMFFDDFKLPKKDVRIGLASNRIGVRTFDIAGIDDEAKFDNAVRFKAHEVLPVAQHESVLDYRVLEERLTEAGEPSRRILLVVAPRDQVEPYVNVAQQAGIRLAGLDLEALSLLRAFVDPKPFAVRAVDDTSTVIVSIGHESTTLLVAGGGVCDFTRVFDWGGGTLQDAVTQELDVHPVEAATILRHLSLSGPGRQYETLEDAARARAIEAVRLRLTPFARELVSSLQFYQTQPDSLGIGEIVITGGTSHLEGLAEALHQMIGVSVRVGDPLARVHVSGDLDPAIEATIGSMAVPIGLAIEDERMRCVDLLPSDVRAAARKRPTLVAIALPVAVAVPVVALGFMFMSAHGNVSDSQAELDAVAAQIATLPKPQHPVIDVSLQGDQAQRAQAVANVLGSRVAWDAVLRDVSRVLPENVWLSSLQAQVAPTAAAGTVPVAATATPGVASAPTGAQIDGYTYAQTDVARLLARLATLPTLSNVTLTSSRVELKGTKSVVHFQIAADLNTGGS